MMLIAALCITVFMGVSNGLYSLVASDLACYDATAFETDYNFHAPAVGSLVGVELEWVSGGVTCDYNKYPYENWGCTGWGTDRLFMNVLQHQSDGSMDRIYPTSSTDGLTDLGTWSCSNGCTARYSVFSGEYTATSPSLVWIDEANPITVTTSDTFSLQYSEGCCGSSTGDNDGTACAKVHFYYPGDEPAMLGKRMADLEGRVDTVESDVSTVNDDMDAVESDVATIQSAVDTVESDVETVAERADSNSWAQYVYVQEEMDWDSANDYCASTYGTTLATIKNDDDALTMYEMLKEYTYFWVGLRDRDEDGVHEWESGYPCDADCGTQWLVDDGTALVSDECVYVALAATGYADILRDISCDVDRFSFACDAPVLGNRMADLEVRVDTVESDVSTVNDEVDTVESDVATIQTAVDTVESDIETVEERVRANSWAQYVYVQEAMDWDDANDYCALTYGTTLATIKNDDDALTMYEMLKEYTYFWVGLRDRDEDGVHEWESGYPCDDCGTQWLLDDGTALVSDECVYVALGATGYADILRDYPCDVDRFSFACDAPLPGMADVESRLQSLENIISGFNDAIDSESASVAAPVGLIPYGDLALYALAAINVAMLLCLFVYCVTKREASYGKVVMYDTDRV